MMNPKKILGFILLELTLFLGLLGTQAFAVPIFFNLGYGGTVSYGGGGSPFVTTNGAVASVSNGTTTLYITGGDLDFSTGGYTGGSGTSMAFVNNYGTGGMLNIAGNIGSGLVPLLSGSFSNISTFQCCSGSSPHFLSSFSGLLNVSSVNANLASALGFNLPATGGSIAQVEIYFRSAPRGPGRAFSGIQGGGAVAVADSVPVPEPASLLLLGLGLLGFWVWGRKKFRNVEKR